MTAPSSHLLFASKAARGPPPWQSGQSMTDPLEIFMVTGYNTEIEKRDNNFTTIPMGSYRTIILRGLLQNEDSKFFISPDKSHWCKSTHSGRVDIYLMK